MNLGVLLDMAALGHPDRIVSGREDTQMSALQLQELAAGGGSVLTGSGAGHAVILGRNGPIMPILMFSAARAGIPFTPMNYRLSAEQIQELLSDLHDPLIVADTDYLDVVGKGRLVVTTPDFIGMCSKTRPGEPISIDDESPAVMLFTSGTTSKPKIVPIRHENLASYVFSTVEFGSASPIDTALVTVPPYHVAAVGAVLSNLYAGRRVLYLPDFNAAQWLALVRDEAVSTAMVVPTMLARIVEYLDEAAPGQIAEAPALRTISYGGARMPAAVLNSALRAFPHCGFVNAYGLTETSSTIALLGPDEHREALAATDDAGRARLSSAGRPVPGIELQIRDDDNAVADVGVVGELWVRGAQVSGEYVGLGSVLDEQGWFPTRDRAYLDEQGYLFIEGRSDDTIIRGGENIAPAEIEDVLLTHAAVREAVVVGVPDEEWGQRLIAVVVRRDGHEVSEVELKSLLRGKLRGSRTPDSVLWRDELPYTPTGKLLRREVALEVAAADSTARSVGSAGI